jgi:hypothetical protein
MTQREINDAYRYFCSHVPPAYTQKILKNMPNNKGFILNGIVYYGTAPGKADTSVTVLFEKTKGMPRTMSLVHEIRRNEHCVYRVDKAAKTRELVYRQTRRCFSG